VQNLSSFLKKINYKKQPDSNLVTEIKQKQDYIKNNCPNNEEDAKKRIDEMIESSGHYTTILNDNRIDLTVKHNNKPVAIFEVKSPKNRSEMISLSNINRKALHEIIINLLEMQEREELPLYVVITNGIEWYAMYTETLLLYLDIEIKSPDIRIALDLTNNKQVLPFYKQSSLNKKDKYYVLSQYLGSEVNFLAKCTKSIFVFYKPEDIAVFLSEDILAGQYNPNVNNKLNSDFYSALLYIFGLKEVKEASKKQIVPNKIPNTFYHQISSRLSMKNSSLKEDELYEKTLELIIIWLNRILFLKLFEGRLILFNNGDKRYKFMDINRITTTTKLKQLFFEVLAVPENKRINQHFKDIPYLNSSLFEEKPIEKKLSISDVAGDEKIPYYGSTVLSGTDNKRKKGSVKLLDYLFEFLDAFDFSTEQTKDLIRQSDLISPAVLGLVFEKINGYKDGSYYTPSTITDYMAENAVKMAITSKVNETFATKYKDFNSFESAFFAGHLDKEKVRDIVYNLLILDPAVGSGHFLVSALNVLLYIRWRLFSFDDQEIRSDFNVVLENNDVRYKWQNGKIFEYKRPTKEKPNEKAQRFQEAIFNTKRDIIENNLFGVDINPKAVEIARLRLWIELLKNAYYTKESDYTRMETLPNIDINIREGDSLRAPIIEVPSSLFSQGNRQLIVEYKKLFKSYQNAAGEEKQRLKEEINKKRTTILSNAKAESYDKLIWTIDFPQILTDDGKFIGFDIVIANPPYVRIYRDNIKPSMVKYLKENYESAFKKFDLYVVFIEKGVKLLKERGIITYIVPDKWISQSYGQKLRNLILKKCKIISLIDLTNQKIFEATVNNFVFTFMRDNRNESNYFLYATDITLSNKKYIKQSKLQKDKPFLLNISDKDERIVEKINTQSIKVKDICYVNWGCRPSPQKEYIADYKVNDLYKPLIRGRNIEKYYIEPNKKWVKYVSSMYNPLFKDLFENTTIVFKDIIGKGNITASLNKNNYYSDFTVINLLKWEDYKNSDAKRKKFPISYEKYSFYNIKFVLGLVNSKLISFYFNKTMRNGLHTLPNNVKKLPIPRISEPQQQPFIDLANQILAITSKNSYNLKRDTEDNEKVKELESQIDQMVYKLYNLTPEEIKIVEESK